MTIQKDNLSRARMKRRKKTETKKVEKKKFGIF